eukprot:747637-Hanusia_phi.AAC.1
MSAVAGWNKTAKLSWTRAENLRVDFLALCGDGTDRQEGEVAVMMNNRNVHIAINLDGWTSMGRSEESHRPSLPTSLSLLSSPLLSHHLFYLLASPSFVFSPPSLLRLPPPLLSSPLLASPRLSLFAPALVHFVAEQTKFSPSMGLRCRNAGRGEGKRTGKQTETKGAGVGESWGERSYSGAGTVHGFPGIDGSSELAVVGNGQGYQPAR